MSRLYQPRVAGRTVSQLGESPFWHPVEQVLYHVDIPGRAVRRLDPATGEERSWPLPVDPGCCAPIDGGGIVIAARDGFRRFDPETGDSERFLEAPYADAAIERFNDGRCDAQGRFWCGTVYEPKDASRAALYRLERGELTRHADDVTTANGLAFSPDGRRAYWADTPAHRIDVFDVDAERGALANRRVWRRFDERPPGPLTADYLGRPDGATVDAQGCYWVAMFEGARVLRLSPEGDVLLDVALPVQCPTMPCLGGPELRTLYVTTACFRRPDEELRRQPDAGRVLAFEVEVPGLPCAVYRP